MLDQFLPRQVDNTYRGQRLGLWILGLLVAMKLAMGLNSTFNGHEVASSADGIPLDSYGPDGARTMVAMFAIWGLGQVMLGLLGLLALVRYRALVSFLFALLLAEQVCRKAILYFLPIAKVGSPPGTVVNLVFLSLMLLGLALSLWSRRQPQPER